MQIVVPIWLDKNMAPDAGKQLRSESIKSFGGQRES
jgi:hypothetical protein